MKIKILALAAVPVLALVATVGPSVAGSPRTDSSHTLWVTTSTDGAVITSSVDMKVGDHLKFSGCGYVPGVGVTVSVHSPTATAFFGGIAGSDGCFAANNEDYVATVAGSYTASSFQSSKRKADAVTLFSVST